jgi:hypothetical protein
MANHLILKIETCLDCPRAVGAPDGAWTCTDVNKLIGRTHELKGQKTLPAFCPLTVRFIGTKETIDAIRTTALLKNKLERLSTFVKAFDCFVRITGGKVVCDVCKASAKTASAIKHAEICPISIANGVLADKEAATLEDALIEKIVEML